jgi:regulatory protein
VNGKITKIQVQVKNKNRCSIFLDDKFAFGVYLKTLDVYELSSGTVLSEDKVNEILDYDGNLYCFNQGLKLLSFSSKSEKMLRDKLIEKEFTKDQVSYALEKLKELGYVDDYYFAENFIENRKKRYGAQRLKNELYHRGISREIADQVLSENTDESEEIATAIKNSRSKWERYKEDPKGYEKMCNFLYRRGYKYDLIKKVIDELRNELN